MIAPQFVFPLHNEIFVDNFAGGGGASTGIEQALGRCVDVALNHDRQALAMHRMNHPQTEHYCEDIRIADPVKIARGRPVGGIWFSPDCKHFSKAKGGKPRDKSIRGLAWVVLNWVNKVEPRVIFLENVEEFQTWGPLRPDGSPSAWRKGWYFKCFVGALKRRGYKVEHRELRACDYGAPTIRKRFFLVARRDGQPIVWPKPTHGGVRQPAHRAIAECLDFSLPCPSIFLTKEEAHKVRAIRPLADNTLKRIAKGIDRFVLKDKQPFFVSYAQQGGASRSARQPLHTICASNKDQNQLVAVHVTKYNTGSVGHGCADPALTVTARSRLNGGGGNGFGLVAASVVKMRGDNTGDSANAPLHTISAGGQHHAVAACYLAQQNGGYNTTPGHRADTPCSTIAGTGSQQQLVTAITVPYYGSERDGGGVTAPARTVTTKDRFGLVQMDCDVPPFTPGMRTAALRVVAFLRAHSVDVQGEYAMVGDYVIIDIGLRMLTPRELYLAQGFPVDYIIDQGLDYDAAERPVRIALTKTAQVRMVGNSVCPPLSRALVAANCADMAAEGRHP